MCVCAARGEAAAPRNLSFVMRVPGLDPGIDPRIQRVVMPAKAGTQYSLWK
jgi:hypothetical protein